MPLQVLLIDNQAHDIELVQKALHDKDLPVATKLYVAHNIVEAEKILAEHHISHQHYVDLILLGNAISTPEEIKWLKEFKRSHACRLIPIIMFTSTEDEALIRAAYQQYASAYLVKPKTLNELRDMLHAMLLFWGKIARLPPFTRMS